MADRKITDLTALAAGSQATGDLLTIVDVSEGAAADKNKKITVENLFKGIPGDVGIGTSSPVTQLEVKNTSSGVSAAFTSSNTGTSELLLGDTDDINIQRIISDHSNNSLQIHTNNSERMRIDSSGNVFIACTAVPSSSVAGILLRGNASGSTYFSAGSATTTWNQIRFFNGNGQVGTIQTSGSATSYNTSSDYRLKENVVDIADGIDRVKQLQPRRFNFIADADATVDGFLAHEAQTVVPEAVTGTHNEVDNDGNAVMQGIDQSKLVPLLTAALQEAIAKIETLETKVAALEAQ